MDKQGCLRLDLFFFIYIVLLRINKLLLKFMQEREIIASLEMEEREHKRYTARKSSAAVQAYENTMVGLLLEYFLW